jgi:hypothetical protein
VHELDGMGQTGQKHAFMVSFVATFPFPCQSNCPDRIPELFAPLVSVPQAFSEGIPNDHLGAQ